MKEKFPIRMVVGCKCGGEHDPNCRGSSPHGHGCNNLHREILYRS